MCRPRWTGTLVNKADGEELSYLYWEATASENPLSKSMLPFDPSNVRLDAENSILLPFDQVIPHLQKALKLLALNIEARTDFITYWLPELMRLNDQHVALRFVPQAEYERAARYSRSPRRPTASLASFGSLRASPRRWRRPMRGSKRRGRVGDGPLGLGGWLELGGFRHFALSRARVVRRHRMRLPSDKRSRGGHAHRKLVSTFPLSRSSSQPGLISAFMTPHSPHYTFH